MTFPEFISKEEKVSGLNKFYTKPCFSHHQFTHVLYNEDGIRSITFLCLKSILNTSVKNIIYLVHFIEVS